MPFWDRKPAVPADEQAIADFLSAMSLDPATTEGSTWDEAATKRLLGVDDPSFTAFAAQFAGSSFGGGLLRFQPVVGDLGLTAWNTAEGWRDAWPSMPRSAVFASDWRGNLYFFDPGRTPSGDRKVAWLTIGTGEYEVLDMSFREFIGTVMSQMWRDILDEPLFATWLGQGGSVPDADHCVGHKVPLVLGGSNTFENLEPLFLRVWVYMAGQIYEQTKDLPPGTQITGIELTK